jgi:hypothetical protein
MHLTPLRLRLNRCNLINRGAGNARRSADAQKEFIKMCDCISRVNKEMETNGFNMRIDVPFTMSKVRRCCIETEKANPKGKKKVRLFASYCPFCGEDYAAEQTLALDASPQAVVKVEGN